MRRLETGERWRAAEIVLRAFGLGLLALCAAASLWLFRLVNQPPAHEPTTVELLCATGAFLGGALLIEGVGLFQPVELSARYRRFPL